MLPWAFGQMIFIDCWIALHAWKVQRIVGSGAVGRPIGASQQTGTVFRSHGAAATRAHTRGENKN